MDRLDTFLGCGYNFFTHKYANVDVRHNQQSTRMLGLLFIYLFIFHKHLRTFHLLLDKPWSQISVPSSPRFLPSTFIAHRVQQSHCSSIFHRVLLTYALALVPQVKLYARKSHRTNLYEYALEGGFELTKLTYTRLQDNLIHRRGDRLLYTTILTAQSYNTCTTTVYTIRTARSTGDKNYEVSC